jgi:putative tricarboxylic transport membrane protein
MADRDNWASERAGPIRSPQDFLGGVVMLLVGAFAVWQGLELPAGTLGGMGPGMLPRALAILLAALGVLLLIDALLQDGSPLERWSLRGLVFVLGAVIMFGLSVRPLGLAAAGPLVIFISALASSETHWLETIAFGIVMTAFSIGLFKLALGLPIPLAPWLIGY